MKRRSGLIWAGRGIVCGEAGWDRLITDTKEQTMTPLRTGGVSPKPVPFERIGRKLDAQIYDLFLHIALFEIFNKNRQRGVSYLLPVNRL